MDNDSAVFHDAVAWARTLTAANDIGFPEYEEYLVLAADRCDFDWEGYDPDENLFHDLPEEYELAYLTVKLERLKAKIRKDRGLDLDGI